MGGRGGGGVADEGGVNRRLKSKGYFILFMYILMIL